MQMDHFAIVTTNKNCAFSISEPDFRKYDRTSKSCQELCDRDNVDKNLQVIVYKVERTSS